MRKRNAFRPVLGDRLLEGRALLSVVPGSALVESAAKVTAITGNLNGSLSGTGHYTGSGTLKGLGVVDASGSVTEKQFRRGADLKGTITLVSETNHANTLTVRVEGRSTRASEVPVKVRITSGTGSFARLTGTGTALFKTTTSGSANFSGIRVAARTR